MPKKHRLGKSLCFYIQVSQMIKQIFQGDDNHPHLTEW